MVTTWKQLEEQWYGNHILKIANFDINLLLINKSELKYILKL